MHTTQDLNRAADNIRILAAATVEKAKSGHPGGAMGGADFINVLFSEFLEYDPENPFWVDRDRFFLDPGHMSPMLYSVLALTGKYSMEDLQQFRQWGSITPGHPELDVAHGIENTSGPLGQGHTYAVGAAIAAKFLKARFGEAVNHTIYAYVSDGGIQEEAPSLGKPVLVMRDTTERPEAVTAGTVRLVGTDKQRIVEEVTRLLKDENEYQAMSRAHNPYGDGQACSRILEALKNNRISL